MIIKAENISRQFMRKRGESNIFQAVKDTSLTLNPGSLTVLTGRSGGGKSTLMNMLSGLLAPTGGRVYADDTDLYSLDDDRLSLFRNEHFGMIPQGQSAVFSLNVLENILLPMRLYGMDRKKPEEFEKALAYADSLLELTGIKDLKDVKPNELSGGEMRRMAIARALIRNPEVIFADEPTGDLDDANTEIILKLLKSLAQEGRTVLLVTHEKEAAEYADFMYRVDGGVLTEV